MSCHGGVFGLFGKDKAWKIASCFAKVFKVHMMSCRCTGVCKRRSNESIVFPLESQKIVELQWDSVTGTATKSRWILSKYLPCLHSFQARPEADQLVNRSRFVKYFCAMSGSPRCIFAWVLSWSTHTSISTHVAGWPSRGLCYKMGPESHITNAPHFYGHSVAGTATKSTWILSKYLPCLHSFQARPEADE